MRGRAATQVAALEQQDVLGTQRREVICGTAAANTAADHDYFRAGVIRCRGHSAPRQSRCFVQRQGRRARDRSHCRRRAPAKNKILVGSEITVQIGGARAQNSPAVSKRSNFQVSFMSFSSARRAAFLSRLRSAAMITE